MSELSPEQVAEIHDVYELADQFVREVILYRETVVIPANNELRYAGHHLLKALTSTTPQETLAEYRNAKSHARRALYEASEAGILRAVDDILSFREQYRNVVIVEVIRDYQDILLLAHKAKDLLRRGRQNRETVEQQTAEYMELFEQLKDAYRKLDAGRDDLNAKIAQAQDQKRRYFLQLGLRVAAVLIALAALAFSWPFFSVP